MSRKVALHQFFEQLVNELYGLMDKEVRIVEEATRES